MLIGLCGKKQSGKDTIADHIINNYYFRKRAFAEPLKEACKIIFNFSDEQVYGDLKEVYDERWNETPRHLLQLVGTELFRNTLSKYSDSIGDNIWLKNFELWYAKNNEHNIIITDCRFLNEINLIKKLGGLVILIERESLNNLDTHHSENDFLKYNNFDYKILNNSSLDDLFVKVDEIMKKLTFLYHYRLIYYSY